MAFKVKGGGGPRGGANHVSHSSAAEYFREAIAYVAKSEAAKTVYDTLEGLGTEIPIEVIHDDNDYYAHAYAGGGYVHWDPLSALKVTESGWQSPAVGLIHEIYHCYQELCLKTLYPSMPQKLVSLGPGNGGGKSNVSKEEIDTVVFESKVCQQLGKCGHKNETPRTTYFYVLGSVNVTSPTSTGKA